MRCFNTNQCQDQPIIYCHIYFVVIHCPVLHRKDNLSWSTAVTEWNTTVFVTCDVDYKLSDPDHQNLTCLDTRQWDKDQTAISCICKSPQP